MRAADALEPTGLSDTAYLPPTLLLTGSYKLEKIWIFISLQKRLRSVVFKVLKDVCRCQTKCGRSTIAVFSKLSQRHPPCLLLVHPGKKHAHTECRCSNHKPRMIRCETLATASTVYLFQFVHGLFNCDIQS